MKAILIYKRQTTAFAFSLLLPMVALGQDSSSVSATKTAPTGLENVGISYFNYMNGPTLAENEGAYSINHYISLAYKLGNDWSLKLSIRPDQKLGKYDEDESTFTQGDSYLTLGMPALFKGDGGLKVTSQLRYYAPLSESSKKKQLSGKIVPRVYVSQSIGKLNLLYLLIPSIYLHQTSEKGQTLVSHGHYLSASYSVTPKFSLDFALYPGWAVKRGEGSSFNENTPMYPGFSYSFTDKASLSTYIEVLTNKPEMKTASLGSSLSYTLL